MDVVNGWGELGPVLGNCGSMWGSPTGCVVGTSGPPGALADGTADGAVCVRPASCPPWSFHPQSRGVSVLSPDCGKEQTPFCGRSRSGWSQDGCR